MAARGLRLLAACAVAWPASAGPLREALVSTVLPETVAAAGAGRIYVSPRADSSADLLWTSTEDQAVWTRLSAQGQRRAGDLKLDEDPELVVGSGFVALPNDVVAVVRNSRSGREKHLTEFDANGKMLRTLEVPSGDLDGWTGRVAELLFGFNKAKGTLEYTLWGETTGGGHFGSRSRSVDFKWFDSLGGGGGCSHNLASRGDHNHAVQAPGRWCLQDGFGGIYQWLTRNVNTYKFRYDYGYPTGALGDVVAYEGGFFVSFAAPRDNHFEAWGGSTTVRTDVGVIFVDYYNTQSAPRQVTWITSTPDKTEARVKLTLWGPPGSGRLLLFWVETDDVKDSSCFDTSCFHSSCSTSSCNYMADRSAVHYVAELEAVPDNQGYHAKEVSRESITDLATWKELQTFTSFPNGDVGWANSDSSSSGIKFTRMRYPDRVNGGMTEWGQCDCATKLKKRACANPVPSNGGAACQGATQMACGADEACISFSAEALQSYPAGLNPATQDPSGGLWVSFAQKGGMGQCVPATPPEQDCSASPRCCGTGKVCCQKDAQFASCVTAETCAANTRGSWTGRNLSAEAWLTRDGNNVYGRVPWEIWPDMASAGASSSGIRYMGKFDSLESCQEAAVESLRGGLQIYAVTWHITSFGDSRWAKTCYGSLSAFWDPVSQGGVMTSKYTLPCNLCGEVTTTTTTSTVPTTTTTARAASWTLVDGGVDRACRGSNANDNSASYYVLNQMATLDDCKAKCEGTSGCQGIEFHGRGRCEVWIRPQGIQSSRRVLGYTCLRLQEASPWLPVDGATDRACRGASSSDNSPSYYTLHTRVDSLEACRAKCALAATCRGIEYSQSRGRCEVWTRSKGIEASHLVRGFSCFRFVPSEEVQHATSLALAQKRLRSRRHSFLGTALVQQLSASKKIGWTQEL